MIKYQEGINMSRSEKILLKVICGAKTKPYQVKQVQKFPNFPGVQLMGVRTKKY